MPRALRIGVFPLLAAVCLLGFAQGARAQEAPPPAYLAVVEGAATLERNGEIEPAVRDMPFVPGDRLRTANGRVEIVFPDGTAIEVAENSEVEALSPTRVRLIAGTFDHLPRQAAAGTDSAQYLPADLQSYGSTFDQNGTWGYSAPYGYVWYPRVAPDWRPYYYGSWAAVPSYGWTWVGVDQWSWPTHHYGRWGYFRNSWFWIPGRTWSAAWVSWGSAADYVSWCPLGFDNRAVFALSFGYGRPWNGWTVLSRSHFGGRGYYANRYAVDPRRFDRNTPFIQHARAPIALPHERTRQTNSYRGVDSYPTVDAPRRTPNADRRLSNDDLRGTNPAAGVAVPRRAYPSEAPRAPAPTVAPGPRYRTATPESRPAMPIAPAAPAYRVPGDANRAMPRYRTTTPESTPTMPIAPAAPASRAPGDANRAVPRYSASPPPTASHPSAVGPPAPASPPASAPPPVRYRPPTGEARSAGAPAQPAPAPQPAPPAARSAPRDAQQTTGTARERGAGDGQPSHTRRPR